MCVCVCAKSARSLAWARIASWTGTAALVKGQPCQPQNPPTIYLIKASRAKSRSVKSTGTHLLQSTVHAILHQCSHQDSSNRVLSCGKSKTPRLLCRVVLHGCIYVNWAGAELAFYNGLIHVYLTCAYLIGENISLDFFTKGNVQINLHHHAPECLLHRSCIEATGAELNHCSQQ